MVKPTEMEREIAKAIATVWVEQNPPIMRKHDKSDGIKGQIKALTPLFRPHALAAIRAIVGQLIFDRVEPSVRDIVAKTIASTHEIGQGRLRMECDEGKATALTIEYVKEAEKGKRG